MNWFLQCTDCGKSFPLEPGRYLCDVCSMRQEPERPLRGILECRWEAAQPSHYNPGTTFPRWQDWLPVASTYFPPIPVGNTPLWEPERLRELTGLPNLYFKDDTCEPSGSFKDRASFLVAAFALERGIREIALASTGNAASSMAAVGAASSINIRVFLPKKAPIAKRIQVLQYGAALTEIDGTYDKAFDASLAYSRETGVLSRNTAYNPLTIEGKKTVSFEIAAQLAEQHTTADHIFVPVGDGVILSGLYKGFEDLMRLGVLKRMPTIWACQAEGSSAIARALFQLTEGIVSRGFTADYRTPGAVFAPEIFSRPIPSDTIADSISVDVPRNGYHALGKLCTYGGKAVVVSDREILMAQRELASHSGIFAEPSSSTAWAGFRKALRDQAHGAEQGTGSPVIQQEDTVVILITGTGLKDTSGALKALEL